MHYVTAAIAALGLLAVVVFAVQNLQVVEVDFLFWSLKLSKFLVILSSYLLGMLTGSAVVTLVKRYVQG